MITADCGLTQVWGLDFGFWLLGSSDRGFQRSPRNVTFSLIYAGCHAVEKMTRNSNALEHDGSMMPWWNLPPTCMDPLVFQIFGQSSNHHERMGTCEYRDWFHSVVTSCRLSTLSTLMVSVMELKTIECVAFFYNKGAKGDDFIQKNKFRCQVDPATMRSLVKLWNHVR